MNTRLDKEIARLIAEINASTDAKLIAELKVKLRGCELASAIVS